MAETDNWNNERPLAEITCTSSDCARNLHSFLKISPRKESYRSERCRECGVDLIDWERLDHNDLTDVEHTVACLEREMIRHTYWHEVIDLRAVNHAKRKGLLGVREAAIKRIRTSVGPPRSEIYRDGTQTPKIGNVIHYAQHATATCCRKCIEAWHGIEREVPLSEDQIGYMTELVMHYVKKRLPDLALHGINVPSIRSG